MVALWDTSQAKWSFCIDLQAQSGPKYTVFISFTEHTPMSWFTPFKEFVQVLLHLHFYSLYTLINMLVYEIYEAANCNFADQNRWFRKGEEGKEEKR